LSLRAGRFYSPLSYERTHYYAPVRLLTSRPLTADIAFHEWADTGVALFGRHGMVGFDAALVNGPAALTERGVALPDVRDNNADKTAVGRLALFPRAGVEAGIAGATGAYDPAGRRRFQLAEADLRAQTDRPAGWAEF